MIGNVTIKNVEAKLLRIAIEQSYNAVVITNADMSRGGPFIVYCNASFCEMTGYAAKELRGKSPRMLQGPESDPGTIDSMRTALNQATFWEGSGINYRKSGEPYVVKWNISPVFGNGVEVTHFVSVQQEITRRVRAEEENTALAGLLNRSSDPSLVVDADKRIVFANTAFETLTGCAASALKGEVATFLQPEAQEPERYQAMLDALTAGRPFQASLISRNSAGERHTLVHAIEPIRNSAGRTTHFIATLTQE